jgi:two-component system alkaline phosphatase synthesis response regulator PhoP
MAEKTKKANLLVVDDEDDILELLVYNLEREGYQVTGVKSGEEALDIIQAKDFDLIVLDLMLPGIDGLEVCKQIKSSNEAMQIPIIMLTAKGEESDVVIGLELGADDYVTKPFSPRILLARIKTILRRKVDKSEATPDCVLKIDNLTIDPIRFEARVNEAPINLTYSEFSLLHFLAQKPGWVFSRYQIVDALKGEDYAVTERSVDVQVVGLRKKLGELGKWIETVRGVGYRFKELS